MDGSELNGSEIDGGEVGDDEVGKKVQKLSKSKNLSKSKKMVRSDFLTPKAKLAFTELRQTFVKVPILHHFDPERHIWIKTDVSGYTIGGVFSQLTLDNLSQCHPVVFFFCKMIPIETRYKTYNGELLAIVKVFKTWKHYLKSSQHKLLMFTNHNNLCWFMDIKNLSSRQVRWV